MDNLIEIGFYQIGEWKLNNKSLEFDLKKNPHSNNILYFFESNNIILYIGKTTQGTIKRMKGYSKPGKDQRTNIKNNKNIIEMLEKGNKVNIYILEDKEDLKYGDFHINLPAGLEDELIKKYCPKWNNLGK